MQLVITLMADATLRLDLSTVEKDHVYYWCSCGESAHESQPWCDQVGCKDTKPESHSCGSLWGGVAPLWRELFIFGSQGFQKFAVMGNSGSSKGSPNTAAIDELINSNDMVVFSSSTCPFCQQALAALREAGYTPKVVESFDRGALSAKCGGSTSVPKVFVKQNFIG
ncbi:GRXC4, partial [Symbiodinium sp. CCMP2592]